METDKYSIKLGLSRSIWSILAIGLMARVYLFIKAPFVSPDAYLYIQQAKAFYYGLHEQLLNCYSYLSPYPLIVGLGYHVFGDWLLTAQVVNVVFSVLSIIPLYYLLRLFFEDTISLMTSLIFALLPAYLWVSIDGLRDPIFWFFSLWGMFFYISFIENRKYCYLFCCSLLFLVSTWARIEAVLFIIITTLHLLFSKMPNKWRTLAVYLSPYFIIFIISYTLSNGSKLENIQFLRLKKFIRGPSIMISKYSSLRDMLEQLDRSEFYKTDIYFFDRIHSLIWVIALVALIVHFVESFFYAPVIFMIVGIWTMSPRLKDRKVSYIVVLTSSALVFLYLSTIYSWHAAPRHLAILMLPSFVYIGEGLKHIQSHLNRHCRYSAKTIHLSFIALFVLIFIPKIIIANFDHDKLIFKAIGKDIFEHSSEMHEVRVCGDFPGIRHISFYANLERNNASCFYEKSICDMKKEDAINCLIQNSCDYLILSNNKDEDLKTDPKFDGKDLSLKKMRNYDSEKLGSITLYEIEPQ